MTITIQKATLAHLENLYKIEQQCFTQEAFSKNQIEWLLKSPVAVSFLAKENNEIVGFIIGLVYENADKRIGRIFTIDVAPAHRRKGVGIRLLKRTEKEFVDLGVKVCYLEVRADNVAAKQLYKKVGYKKIRVLKNYYFQGGHGIRLKKTL